MALFMEVASLYASISGVLSVMFPDIPSSSVMDMPTMRVIAPVPQTVMTGSAKTLPGLEMKEPLCVRVMGATSFRSVSYTHLKPHAAIVPAQAAGVPVIRIHALHHVHGVRTPAPAIGLGERLSLIHI